MLNLPKSTEFNKRIPKQKFYEHAQIKSSTKKFFMEQVRIIYWRNKIATTSTNLTIGKNVTEIEVFEMQLYSKNLDESILKVIDNAIPYHIIFILRYENLQQAWIAYKEGDKIRSYYHTEWLEDLSLTLQGLTLDEVYENFLRQIAGESLQAGQNAKPLKDIIEYNEKIQQLQKQIEKLEKKVKIEKQFNIQVKLNDELKSLRKELVKLIGKNENAIG